MEIVPQIHIVPATRGCNVYLIEEPILTLVDTGLPHNAAAILGYIARLGRRPDDLGRIILTHHHIDHAGSVAELIMRTGAQILVHSADADAVESRWQVLQPGFEGVKGLADQLVERFRSREEIRVTERLRDGEILPVLGGLEVVHTPDHTAGSICLYSRERSLVFVGDMVINNVNRLSRPLPTYGSRRERFEDSLQRLASLDFETCLFGHGPPVIHDGSRLVRDMAARPQPSFLPWRILRNFGTLAAFALRLKRRRED